MYVCLRPSQHPCPRFCLGDLSSRTRGAEPLVPRCTARVRLHRQNRHEPCILYGGVFLWAFAYVGRACSNSAPTPAQKARATSSSAGENASALGALNSPSLPTNWTTAATDGVEGSATLTLMTAPSHHVMRVESTQYGTWVCADG